jgi:3D (Asp-Asp-Asp) domain-containing protein
MEFMLWKTRPAKNTVRPNIRAAIRSTVKILQIVVAMFAFALTLSWLADKTIEPPKGGGDAYAAWESPAALANFENTVRTVVQEEIEAGIQDMVSSAAAVNGVRKVTVTAYTASRDECDEDPGNTAIMTKPVVGWTVAVSRDLLEEGWTFGLKVWIDGVGVREISDVMNEKWSSRIDVLVGKKKDAKRFGRREGVVAVLIGG